jgi:Tfp pilus assembly protein PilN
MRQVNLLPERLQQAEEKRIIRDSIIITISLTLLLVLSLHFLLVSRVIRLKKIIDRLTIAKETPEVRELRKEINRLKTEEQTFINKNRVFLDILAMGTSYPYILNSIGEATSNKVWLTKLSVDAKNGICQFDGKSFDIQLVSEFMLELKKMAHFRNVELTSMERGKEMGEKAVAFRITCNLK